MVENRKINSDGLEKRGRTVTVPSSVVNSAAKETPKTTDSTGSSQQSSSTQNERK